MTKCAIILAAWTLLAQDPIIRLDVQQVLVPVVVADKKGHHVSGLRASDFRIFEDGVPQDIAYFSSDTAGAVDDITTLSKPTAEQKGPRHTFVICIDTLHASPSSAAHIREALESFFEKEKSTDAQYVLIGIGHQLQVLQAATTNPLAILVKLRSAAFQTAMAGPGAPVLSAQLQNIRTRMDEFCRRCACGNRSGQRACDAEIDSLKQSIDAEADRWTAPTNALLEQFKNVVDELAKLPTGRTLILISDGFDINPKREFYSVVSAYLPNRPQFHLDDSTAGLEPALKIAADRNIIIDTIDSRGNTPPSLATSGLMDASASNRTSGDYNVSGTNRSASRSPALTASSKPAAFSNESASMQQLARATGGIYFHDSADLMKQFRSALADGRQFYVLAYVPKNPAHDGKFHSITVETTGQKLSIRAKSGYWAQ